MKKIILSVLFVSLIPGFALAQFTVPQGGTGKTGFPQNSFIYADNGGLQHLQATSSPTVDRIVATSTKPSIFPYASTTNITSVLASTTDQIISHFPLTILSTAAAGVVQATTVSSPLSFSGSTLSCPTCNTSTSNVISVTATNSTLTISPNTGSVLAGINLANPNAWSALQTFTRASSTQMTFQGPVYDNTNSPGTSGQVFTSNGANNAPSWQVASGGGGKTIDGYFATSSRPSGSYPFATTTSVQSPGALFVTATCSRPNASGGTPFHLDVWNATSNSTTTIGAGVTQNSGGSAQNMSMVQTGLYVSQAAGLVRISWTDVSDGITDASICQSDGYINMQWIRFSN